MILDIYFLVKRNISVLCPLVIFGEIKYGYCSFNIWFTFREIDVFLPRKMLCIFLIRYFLFCFIAESVALGDKRLLRVG